MTTERAIWLTAQLKPNSLRKAEVNLLRQQFEIFSPKITITRTQKDRFTEQSQALFPGYIFVRFNGDAASLRLINNTYGVARLIGQQGTGIKHVPTDFIEDLQQRCDHQGYVQRPNHLEAGDQVLIQRGPFADHVATIETLLPNERVVLLMQLLNRETRITITPDSLKKLQSAVAC